MEDVKNYTLRVEPTVLRKISLIAKREGRTKASMIRVALSEWVERRIKEAKENAA